MHIKSTNYGDISRCYDAIRQRLVHSCGFKYAEADQEIGFMFANLRSMYTKEWYTQQVRRTNATKRLTRQDRSKVYDLTKATVESFNNNELFV